MPGLVLKSYFKYFCINITLNFESMDLEFQFNFISFDVPMYLVKLGFSNYLQVFNFHLLGMFNTQNFTPIAILMYFGKSKYYQINFMPKLNAI